MPGELRDPMIEAAVVCSLEEGTFLTLFLLGEAAELSTLMTSLAFDGDEPGVCGRFFLRASVH